MSTAGKVLVVLILLSALVWVLLTAGVDQLNRNGNQALITLTEKVAKLQDDVRKTQEEVVRAKDQVEVYQEQMDRELAVINSRQNDVQRLASNVADELAHVHYELTSVRETLHNAEQDRTQREAELAADKQALAAARAEANALKTTDLELRNRLDKLRTEFKTTLKASEEALQHVVK